jgi:hypothetical protein
MYHFIIPFTGVRSLCNKIQDLLFRSWDLWRIDLDVQIIATLNRLVARKKRAAVPQHVVESLAKVQTIRPEV